MSIILTVELMKKLYPRISDRQARAFVDKQAAMAIILATPERAALCFAHLAAETGMFTLVGLAENINYTPERMAVVWANRFHRDPNAVRAKYGTGPDWRRKAFNDIYGNRMGNHPGTDDGSNFIGRAAPQVTGRDGYAEISKRTGKDFVNNPTAITAPEVQPEVTQAFWNWKGFNRFADAIATNPGAKETHIANSRTVWNGGHNGLDVVQAQFPRMLAIIKSYRPETAVPVEAIKPVPAETKKDMVLVGVQKDLIAMGYFEIGDADGLIGGKTLGAIQAFFNDRGLDIVNARYPSNELENEIIQAHSQRWHRPIAPGRAYATEKEVADKVGSVAPVQSASMWQNITAWFSGIGAIGGGAVKLLPDAQDQVSPYWYMIQQWFPSVPTLLMFAAVAAVAIYTVRKMNQANKATVEDYQRGKIN